MADSINKPPTEGASIPPKDENSPIQLVVSYEACDHNVTHIISPISEIGDLLQDLGISRCLVTHCPGHCESCWRPEMGEPRRCAAYSVPSYIVCLLRKVAEHPGRGPVRRLLYVVYRELADYYVSPNGLQTCQQRGPDGDCPHSSWGYAWKGFAFLCVSTLLDEDIVHFHDELLVNPPTISGVSHIMNILETAYNEKYPGKTLPWLL